MELCIEQIEFCLICSDDVWDEEHGLYECLALTLTWDEEQYNLNAATLNGFIPTWSMNLNIIFGEGRTEGRIRGLWQWEQLTRYAWSPIKLDQVDLSIFLFDQQHLQPGKFREYSLHLQSQCDFLILDVMGLLTSLAGTPRTRPQSDVLEVFLLSKPTWYQLR